MSHHYVVEARAEDRFAVTREQATLCTSGTLQAANLVADALNAQLATLHKPLRGEMVRIPIEADAQPANVSSNPFAQFQAQLVAELARIVVPKISVNPEPEEFENVADYLIRVAQIFDRMLKTVGEEVNRNSTESLDMSVFDGAFVGAIDGNATFVCDEAARAVRAERDEIESEIRRRDRGSDFADDIFKSIQSMNRALYGV